MDAAGPHAGRQLLLDLLDEAILRDDVYDDSMFNSYRPGLQVSLYEIVEEIKDGIKSGRFRHRDFEPTLRRLWDGGILNAHGAGERERLLHFHHDFDDCRDCQWSGGCHGCRMDKIAAGKVQKVHYLLHTVHATCGG